MDRDLIICKDVFIFPYEHDYVLYLPLISKLIVVNEDTIKLLNAIQQGRKISGNKRIINQLKKLGVFDNYDFPLSENLYNPLQVTFIPSFDCNLKCLYCYSNGGEDSSSFLSLTAAKRAIDLVLNNVLEINGNSLNIGFHGGGEPLLIKNKLLIEQICKYAQLLALKNNLEIQITAVTNGLTLSSLGIEWIKKHFTRLNISLDGPEEIHNGQRLARNSRINSYNKTVASLFLLQQHQFPYGIRTTVTNRSVFRMREIVEHFALELNIKSFHFEPLFECGRCETSNMESPSQEDFIDNFIIAFIRAKELNIDVYYSGASVDRVANRFCGAAGENFFLTPNGKVTTCIESCRIEKNDDLFYIGEFKPEKGEYVFFKDKINYLKDRQICNLDNCQKCICKFSCSGDCLVKVLKQTGDIYNTIGNKRCRSNILLSKFKLLNHLKTSTNGNKYA